jgi:hypothetical protein
MMQVIDPNNLAPDRFVQELNKCLECLPFKIDESIPIIIEKHNTKSDALAWNGIDISSAELRMVIKLFSSDIDARVQYNRLNYWLFVILHELAHINFREQRPESVLDNLEGECNTIAHETLQAYKQKHN